MAFTVLVGAVSFSGSAITFAKLQELMPTRPITFPGQPIVMGLVLAGGFLDARFLPRGEFGAFFSAGAIPLISALLGVKVGAELSVIIDRFRS